MTWDDLHATVTAELTDWRAPTADQELLRLEYLAHLDEHPDGHRKDGPSDHLTASCLVLDPEGRRVLLTHHRKARQWYQFGGHLEQDDSSLAVAALREAREESGIEQIGLVGGILELDRHDLVGDFARCHQHWDVRFVGVTAETLPSVSEESLDVAWFGVEELPNPELGRLVARAVERVSLS